jgi:transcription termination/antitermination protein NusG
MPDVTRMAVAHPPLPQPHPLISYCEPEAQLPWFALYIRQRQREQCEEYLASRAYEYFSPARTEIRQWSDRKKVSTQPLFPGYLFCRFHPRRSAPIVRAPGVMEIVSAGGAYLEVDAVQIENVQRCLQSGYPVDVLPELACGQRVRITSGPMNGVEGVLTVVKQQLRVGLEISMMNRTVLVEVNASQLIPI